MRPERGRRMVGGFGEGWRARERRDRWSVVDDMHRHLTSRRRWLDGRRGRGEGSYTYGTTKSQDDCLPWLPSSFCCPVLVPIHFWHTLAHVRTYGVAVWWRRVNHLCLCGQGPLSLCTRARAVQACDLSSWAVLARLFTPHSMKMKKRDCSDQGLSGNAIINQ